ncbi:hypothetical protein A3A39_01415 [Candidatus Kaiserbacteria bacterium RIFCSPLOWO2_01_FULL_54_13]|uniref:DoxX family protein n=1 Tax=Candidatus Kaiserbacteria bacterium RIFCSPLOWO2_01_FULL_54_13 TaxID=1798512 RepID=A0A1F6F408_9BACT|nr:MAG: hypothetical protein A3A39_01415 [Candidatus Kaiserbacteria bacterium RIFCSPLOWO2_01_FULL_54_13]
MCRVISVRVHEFSLPVLRAGLVVLYLWFGFSQVSNPVDWVAWVPMWPTELTGLSAESIVLLNGGFEIVLGVLLAVGFYTRIAAFLLSLHLFFIAYEIGWNDIGVRDFALAAATLALALGGPDQYSLDKRINRG